MGDGSALRAGGTARRVSLSFLGIALLALALFALLNVRTLEAWGASLAESFKGGLSLPLTLLVVFLAGVLTSLTPCVYPVIPLAITYLGARSAVSRMRAFSLAAAYVLGMVVCYTALGAAAGLTGSTFGAATQKWWIYALVATVVLFFGLSMMGVFNLALPASLQSLVGRSRGPGYKGAFLMGGTSGLVTAPCTAPVLGALILPMIARQSVFMGSLLLAVFGLGMGMLFLVVGTYSGILSSLPKSGKWMNGVKLALGAAILLVSAYFYYRAYLMLPFRASSSASSTARGEASTASRAEASSRGVRMEAGSASPARSEPGGPGPMHAHRTFEARGGSVPGAISVPVAMKPSSESEQDPLHHPIARIVELRPAPNFELEDLKGRRHDLGAYRSRTLHLAFFAVWCPPCLEQIRRIETADARLRGRGYRVLLVGMKEREDLEALKSFAEKRTLPFPVGWDRQGSVARAYGIESIPAHVIIGRDGNIVYQGRDLPEGFEDDAGGSLPP